MSTALLCSPERVDPISFSGARWIEAAADPARVDAIRASLGFSTLAARCLALRWTATEPPDRHWLRPDMGCLHDPLAMHNMGDALARLRFAVARRQRIRIITDYDVDGTTSSLILQAALRLLDRDVAIDYHIPNRFGEGYGFSEQAAQAAIDDGVDLVVTADIGVRDHAAVDRCARAGIDVLICDHHLPAGADVPDRATVLCPPQRGCDYPNPALAACGVSLKVAQALLADHARRDEIVQSLCKLAAVGTVADMVSLTTAENRAIVSLGLAQLNTGRHHPGLAALLGAAGLQAGEIRVSDLGFRVGPRINAAGRIADAKLVVRLLNSRVPDECDALARQLESHNEQRREIQRRLVAQALAELPDPSPAFVLVAGPEREGWHRGVVGIVAARVKDEAHRPTAVVSIQGDVAVGSVRSLPGVHAVRALDAAADLLVKYGGHPAAAGFTVPTEHLPELAARLDAWVRTVVHEDALVQTQSWDAEITPADLGYALLAELEQLAPFGVGNPRPSLLVRDVQPRGVRRIGKDESHLKFLVPRDAGPAVEAVWWGQAGHFEALAGGPVSLIATLSEHRWRGTSRLQLQVVDARPA